MTPHLFLEVLQTPAMLGTSVWLEPGDLCRFGADSANELTLTGEGIPQKAGTLLYDGKRIQLFDSEGARDVHSGASIAVGEFQIRLHEHPSEGDGATPIGRLGGWMQCLPGHLYAVVDAARSPRVMDLLQAVSEFRRLSLFDGDLRNRMADAAPYLIAIPAGSGALDFMLRAVWGKGWACFLAADLTFEAVRAQLRKSLLVRMPEGEPAYFRYFDPDVLPLFLQGSSAKEWAAFAGGITDFVVEQGSNAVIRLRTETKRMEVHSLEQLPC